MENSVERQTEDLNKAATYAVEQSDKSGPHFAYRLELIDASNRASIARKKTLFRDYTDDLSKRRTPP